MNSEVTSLDELLRTAIAPGSRGVDPKRTRRAIVTGSSTGIGRYTAIALAQDGCDVGITYAHDSSAEDAELTAQAVRHFGRKAVVEQADFKDPTVAPAMVDRMVEALGGLDVYVSNAGKMVMQRFPRVELETLEEVFRVNTFAALLGCQRAMQHLLGTAMDREPETKLGEMAESAVQAVGEKIGAAPIKDRETPGRIIVVTSVHEHVASPIDTAYTMTKHALGGFIECAAFETVGKNVTVNGIRPGAIATPMNSMGPEDALDSDAPLLPTSRVGHPAEIADAVRFLASDAASYINGQSYDVDGGLSIGAPMAMGMYRKAVKA